MTNSTQDALKKCKNTSDLKDIQESIEICQELIILCEARYNTIPPSIFDALNILCTIREALLK